MKDLMAMFFYWLIITTLFSIPAILALYKIEGWGWFLFTAVLIASCLRMKVS